MEDVLSVYRPPFDPLFPVVCMDESSKQLVGVAMLFVEVEPLTGRRHVEVTGQRTRRDWAHFIKAMLNERYPDAIKVRLVMDNLNIHSTASLYETFLPSKLGVWLIDWKPITHPNMGVGSRLPKSNSAPSMASVSDAESSTLRPCVAKSPLGRSTAIPVGLLSTGASQAKTLVSSSLVFIRNFSCYQILACMIHEARSENEPKAGNARQAPV